MSHSPFRRLQEAFIEPPQIAEDIALRHKSRLLNIFLLIMIVIFMGVDGYYLASIPGYQPPWYGYVFLVGSYVVNRAGFYRASALSILIMFPVVIFINIVSGTSSSPVTTIYYLIPGLILAGILLSLKLTILFAVVEAAILLSIPFAAPQSFADFESIIGPLSAFLISAVLVLVSISHRNRVEAERQEELRRSEERYRLISSVTSDYVFSNIQDEKGDIALNWVAGAFERISGYTVQEFNERGGWVATIYPDDIEKDARDMDKIRRGETVISELRTVHKDGSIRWVRNYAHPVLDSQQNTLIGIYGAVQDVTEQKQVQQEREDLIRELEAKNAELEQFAYTVSHDLKAPLITIKGFLGFLPEDARSGNVERLEGDLRRIGDATEKMRKLLDDLLELSRIGRLTNPPTVIALKALIDETLGLLQGRLAERKIRITIEDDLPFLYGDRSRLLEVLQNVFDNALKFMGDQSNPQIEIGGQKEPQNGFVTIFVRDNGIGIAPQYHEQIFGLFNRLNPKIDGTGVGLALAKRIVEFHGGRIWVESRVGEGATFYFTLPLADQASPASESPSS
ncbi:MAG: PAS domain S-box protein [Anaerolineae bacterium]|nr:PAS domain S-box protein [Anaerolineae bacterium]MBL8106795.1 PAS domain S-box protein [Anaerolineales bacterium]MCC7190141.1 PAS domain S-box protein [Anaerolineales bacterium]